MRIRTPAKRRIVRPSISRSGAAVATVYLGALAACSAPVDTRSLRDSEIRGALIQSRVECEMATGLPAGNQIVETCAQGGVAIELKRIEAEDNANLQRDAAPVFETPPVPQTYAP